jgi:hypothetical protein
MVGVIGFFLPHNNWVKLEMVARPKRLEMLKMAG